MLEFVVIFFFFSKSVHKKMQSPGMVCALRILASQNRFQSLFNIQYSESRNPFLSQNDVAEEIS